MLVKISTFCCRVGRPDDNLRKSWHVSEIFHRHRGGQRVAGRMGHRNGCEIPFTRTHQRTMLKDPARQSQTRQDAHVSVVGITHIRNDSPRGRWSDLIGFAPADPNLYSGWSAPPLDDS
jgi:hypothetical protein